MRAPKKLMVMAAACAFVAGCSNADTGASSDSGGSDADTITETAPVAASDGGGAASDQGGAMGSDDGGATTGSDAGGEEVPSPESSTEAPAEETTEEASTDEGGVIIEQGNYDLTLADARPTRSWEEASYRVPGSTEQVTAMATELPYCDEEELEFRFAVPSGTIEFTVAQDLDSESSSETLDISLVVDGATEDTAEIGFDESATLSADLTGASAVVLQVENSSCEDGGVNALITSAKVSS